MRGFPEVADIFRAWGPAYRARYAGRLPPRHLRAMAAIEACRTAALGGHVDECDSCGAIRISYNSCRNRHCPKCQSLAKEEWVEARKQDLLPVPYFHVVFTLPEELRALALRNQRVVYDLLFAAAPKTPGAIAGLQSPASFKKFLASLYRKEWVVYCKPPSPERVLEYLGRYTHRVALSNDRILSLDGDQVTFSYRDSSDGDRPACAGRCKQMTLHAFEFIRRFLLHVLPDRFVKIRHGACPELVEGGS